MVSIDYEFMVAHYRAIIEHPTPDVTDRDKEKARAVLDALAMTKKFEVVPVDFIRKLREETHGMESAMYGKLLMRWEKADGSKDGGH